MTVVISLFILNINILLKCNKGTQLHPLKTASQVCEILSLMPIKCAELEEHKTSKQAQDDISENLITTKEDYSLDSI